MSKNDKELLEKVKKIMRSEHKKDSAKLFGILYKNTQNVPFLERKHKRFLNGLDIARKG